MMITILWIILFSGRSTLFHGFFIHWNVGKIPKKSAIINNEIMCENVSSNEVSADHVLRKSFLQIICFGEKKA